MQDHDVCLAPVLDLHEAFHHPQAAAREMLPFDEAYRQADWSRFEGVALFREVNRMNAYNTYLLMEQEKD